MSAASSSGGTARDQAARVLALVPYLHERGEVRLDETAARLGVTPQQLRRDLDVLFMVGLPGGMPDDLIDVDIEALDGDGVIRVSNADYLARPVRFSTAEASALLVALSALAESAGDETRDVVSRALEKLRDVVGRETPRMHVDSERTPSRDIESVLKSAIENARRVEITYHIPTRDEVAPRVVEPRAVESIRGVTYLDAWCLSASADRVFRVDNIVSVRELDASISPQHATQRDLTGEWFAESTTTRVVVRLAPPAHWVPEYHPVVAQRPGPGGTLDVEFEVAGEGWLRRLVLRLAPHALVVEPAGFADSIASAARDALTLYGTPDVD